MTKSGPFSGASLKPLCRWCCRRLWGMPKDGGWWCSYCEDWIVAPKLVDPPVSSSTEKS